MLRYWKCQFQRRDHNATRCQEHQTINLFFERLLSVNLLEAFSIEYADKNGEKVTVSGFYTINQQVLNGLTAEQLKQLQQQGDLQAVYMVLASMEHIPHLLNKKWAQQ